MFKLMNKDSQNPTMRSESRKIINPTKTHLEISAASENNSDLAGMKKCCAVEQLQALSYL
jgi:hypothetical protein